MKNFKLLLFISIFLLSVSNLFATAQIPDKIIYEGKEYKLHSNPMEAYFINNPEKKPKGRLISSALWRGYVATFAFENKTLYLKDIEIQVRKKTDDNSFDTEWKSVISEVVAPNKKLEIDWMTGLLVIPHGKRVRYVHMGYGSTYENYILIEVNKGVFQKAKEFDHKEYAKFKQRQFEAFKKTEEYQKLVTELKKKEGANDELIESFVKSFVINYTSKILVD